MKIAVSSMTEILFDDPRPTTLNIQRALRRLGWRTFGTPKVPRPLYKATFNVLSTKDPSMTRSTSPDLITETPNVCDKIVHWSKLQHPDGPGYPGSDERFSLGAPFGRHFGFARLGIHHELLPPGRRTSRPHAESTEDEFIYVIAGHPTAWIDGHAHRLKPGDGVGFKAGDGVTHTFINETDEPVELLVVGDTSRADNRLHYPLHAEFTESLGDKQWRECPQRELGPHPGTAASPQEDDGCP